MLSFGFTLSNAKTRKFVVQCSHVENFFGFMFGIRMRCYASNMWTTIEDVKLNAEFQSRISPLGSNSSQTWLLQNFVTETALKCYVAVTSKKDGTNICVVKDIRRFLNGWFGAQKTIGHLHDLPCTTRWSLHSFTSDAKVSNPVETKVWNDERDMVLTEKALFISKQSDIGRTSCVIAEL